jgi:MoaA/NifB/PqqE/SkfB family radical SAM enzyme
MTTNNTYLPNKNLRVTLVNKETWEYYDLYFKFFNFELASKWVKEFEKTRYGRKEWRERSVKYAPSQNLNSLEDMGFKEKLNRIVDKINSFYDRQVKRAEDTSEATLNYLHEEYEIYGVRLKEQLANKWWDTAWQRLDDKDPRAVRWPGKIFNEDFHTAFIDLNDAIHSAEAFMQEYDKAWYRKNSEFSILASYEPRVDYKFTEEDKLAFSPFTRFGDLFLGYNTLGKSLLQVLQDNDKRAAINDDIVPQTDWSNEIFMHLKSSSDNPLTRIRFYKLFKSLGLETHGYRFMDPDNNDGYAVIGTLLNQQKDEMYSFGDGLKIDLTKFNSLYDITLVDDIQIESARKSSLFRIPQWKMPLPLQDKKIIKIENQKEAIITWILNDICNYSCRYCPDVLHDGKNVKYDWDVVEPFIDKLFDFYGREHNRKLLFSFSGGEPTMSPFFPQLIKKIYDSGGDITLTTNLSRTARYIRENFKYISTVNCTFHPKYEFDNNTYVDYLEKVKVVSELSVVAVRVMMDPLYWDKCLAIKEEFEKMKDVRVQLVYIDDQYGSSTTKLAEINYTPEQLEVFKTTNTKVVKIKHEELLKKNPLHKLYSSKITATYEDGTTSYLDNQTMINRGQTNFYDYECSIGKESLFIHQNGHIKRGNCEVGGVIGFLNNINSIDWISLTRSVKCNSLRCSCGADIPISKLQR